MNKILDFFGLILAVEFFKKQFSTINHVWKYEVNSVLRGLRLIVQVLFVFSILIPTTYILFFIFALVRLENPFKLPFEVLEGLM